MLVKVFDYLIVFHLRYAVGEWSDCSATCGIGRKTRMISCKLHGVPVSRRKCKHLLRPKNFEKCVNEPCKTRWKPVGKWSEVS